ncbi:MAG: hypothetical protein QW648_03685 [Nanoarchaeales archaeon]
MRKINEIIKEIQKKVIAKLNNGEQYVIISLYDIVVKHNTGVSSAYVIFKILKQWGEEVGLNVEYSNAKLIFSKPETSQS